jgi:hypothetical protein
MGYALLMGKAIGGRQSKHDPDVGKDRIVVMRVSPGPIKVRGGTVESVL